MRRRSIQHGSVPRRRLRAACALLTTALLLGGLGTPGAAATDDDVEGLFDVGGHRLYLTCSGSGPVTVVYLHGAIWEHRNPPHRNALEIRDRLDEEMRVCLYDRRNTGFSDTVDAPQEPADALTDMRRLLRGAGVEPPYLLLGASFGGLLAYLYANEHPDEVTGMVLLDSMFPDELRLEHLFDQQSRQSALRREDECCSPERMAHYKVLRRAWTYVGREPAIPVTYLAALQEPWHVNDYGIPEYDERILDLQAGYVDRFAPGVLTWVDSPHFMEPVVPDEIADAVRGVATSAGLG